MKYEYLTNTPLDKAVEDYINTLEQCGMTYQVEEIPVTQSFGRVTSEAIYANICAPHYNACAMDGIALESALTFGATETTPVKLSTDKFIRVDTGDPLPDGCDAVVMIEDVVEDKEDILLYSPAVPWQHIRQIGEDICAGDMIIPSYTVIEPASMGAMLAGGVMKVKVVKLPVVGIIPTGDEIVLPCENPKQGDIIEFNSTIFSGILTSWGAVPKTYPIVKDKKDLIIAAVQKAVDECDAVILNAGSSAGREDFSTTAIGTVGTVLYHGIAIKPGKPAILGYSGSKPIIGVPGYPVSGMIVLEHIFKPVIERLSMKRQSEVCSLDAKITRNLNTSLKYREFLRTRVSMSEDGGFVAIPLSRGAGVITSFVKADGIIDILQNTEGFEANDVVKVNLLKSEKDLYNTLSIIGSHDPLIDEVTDIMRRFYSDSFISSSHVGSMGGIMAIRRKEAQMGAIHLLDEGTGEYNISYIEKYFPNGGVVLVEGVKRIQGIMVAKGNPKNINSISDLPKISYVNRQKGSGTRILCDYLMKENGIAPSSVYGYEREEFTHTGVAAQIAANTADAGLGILSAAKTYGLDFIPVCEEKYDFLILKSAFENRQVKRFFDIIQGEEFKNRLEHLGGYIIETPGKIRREF